MDVFNKIYFQVSNSVSSTVSQLSGVLPGNPVTREFDASSHVGSAGPGLLWKIYKGVKRSTKQEASIFVLEKRQLEKWNKTDRELILETMRRGVSQLTKIRHPQVLTVQHPLEESRESLAFATEPVFASLANVLGQTTNMPQPTNLSEFKLFEVEIKYGLLQISEGLAFLHNDVKLLHKNICPETVIINQQGAWKIFGFDFCIHNTSPANSPTFFPCEDYSPTVPQVCQPSLDYLAPESVTTQTNTAASDMFSLGMVAYALHSAGGKTVMPVKEMGQFKSRVQQLKNLNPSKLQCVPEQLREYVRLLLNVTPEVRPDAHQFGKIPYFDDVGVKTLNYLDCLLQWDNVQKSQFYKGLPEALTKLPQRVKIKRVLACLVRDLAQPNMIPFVLPSIFDIAQECDKKEFCTYVLPHLKPVMKHIEPIQILLIMLQRMELLLKLTPPEDVQQHVLPMLYRGLDADIPQIHDLCLTVLPTFAGLLDHSNVKNSLLPRIKKLCLSTTSLSVRVNSLLCIGRLLEHLDKWLVLDEILPFLPQISSREPAVLMGILGIYKLALHHKKLGISKEIIATRILPFLMPLCIENGLTLAQFNAIVVLIKEMFCLVENEHRTKLEQLNSVKEQQKVLTETMPSVVPKTKPVEMNEAFKNLGLESIVSGGSMTLEDKQKLAQQQQSMKLFQNQPNIEPIKTNPVPSIPAPKDLTLSLEKEWANLSQFSTPPAQSKMASCNLTSNWSSGNNNNSNINTNVSVNTMNMANANTNIPMNSMNTQNNFNWNSSVKSPLQWPPSANNFSSPFTPQSQWPPSASSFQSAYQGINNSSSSPWSDSKVGLGNQVTKNNNATGNWSALDTLLPVSNNKVPMNQMMNHSQPLLPSPPTNNNSNTRNSNSSFSNQDIMDFLG